MVLHGLFLVRLFDLCLCSVHGDLEEVVVCGVCDHGVRICVGVQRSRREQRRQTVEILEDNASR